MMKEKKIQTLFARIEELLHTHHELLADEKLDREKLAKLLSTNTTYLHSAIRQCADMAVNGYLNRIHVQEIGKRLQESPGSSPSFEILRAEYGFSTYTTFYRTFRSEFGMSPTEYLDRAAQESLKNIL